MKSVFSCLMGTMLMLSAQSNSDTMITQGLKQAVMGLQPIPEEDQRVVLDQTMALLRKHVTFRSDGTASSNSTATGKQQALEWKNLRINGIVSSALTEADRLNGFEKRYLANLTCDATRMWDSKTNRWTDWAPTPYPLFPAAITVEWKNGAVTTRGGSYLPKFTPGPGPSVTVTDTKQADPKISPELPPGMTRGSK